MTERIQIIELDIERCSNTYGVAPCTASVPTTGDQKCFNCLASCQDTANYNAETVTTRYSTATGSKMPPNIELIPNLESVNLRPAKLELGESIGIRANIDLSFVDHRSPDTGVDGDYYLADRDYDPYQQGTYWGRFRARYPFYKGWDIRLLNGTTDQTLEQMEVRHFIVEKMAGPNSNGRFTIQCKDALKLADGKKAQAPSISNGKLSADINSSATSVTLIPSGVGAEYPSSGTAQIGGKEIVTFTRSGDTFTITRAQNNTEAVDHDQDDRFQLCLVYTGERSVNIIQDLLENYANVPSSYIPFADWTSEWEDYIQILYSSVIAQPTSVTDLINELLQQTASTIWWDDSARLIRLEVLREVASNAALYSDDVIKAGTFQVKDQPEKRVSQVWTFYGQLNPLEKLDDTSNYSNSLATVSSTSEQNYGEPSIKQIFSRWIASDDLDAADRLNNLILSRYVDPPRMFSWALQRNENLLEPQLGGGYRIEDRNVQDFDGSNLERPVQVVQVKTGPTGYSVMAEEVLYSETIEPDDPTTKNFTIDTNQNNLNLYTYATDRREINTGDTVNFTITQGTIIGSVSTSAPAMTTGTGWPSGVTINIINRGTIAGKGGAGGKGGDASAISGVETTQPGADGLSGGLALDVLVDCAITNEGIVGGGGGGGGGGGSRTRTSASVEEAVGGGGGGGGQGRVASLGAQGGSATGGTDDDDGDPGSLGNAGSLGAGGIGGLVRGPSISLNITGGRGGDGGAFGQNGEDGEDRTMAGGSLGGSGGLAGDAINKNGNTVTITNNGTIAGNIEA